MRKEQRDVLDVVERAIAGWDKDSLLLMLDRLSMERFASVCRADIEAEMGRKLVESEHEMAPRDASRRGRGRNL